MELAQQIEACLLERGTWVSSEEICEQFSLPDDRALRAVGDHPGLCSAFAISGNKGFKHVAIAQKSEWLHFKHRLRKHGIRELVRVRDLGRRRARVTKCLRRPPMILERDTNQALLTI